MDVQSGSVAIAPAGELWPFLFPGATDSRFKILSPIGFSLFLLATIVLLLRPGDLVPALDKVPIYETLVAITLVVSLPRLINQFSPDAPARAITLLILGVFGAIVLSHLARGSIYDARVGGIEFIKLFLYYLLILAWIDSPRRMRQFLLCLCACCLILTVVALIGYHGWLNLSALFSVQQSVSDSTSDSEFVIDRLRGIGIFGDPNDVCLILAVAVVLCCYFWGHAFLGQKRRGWIWPLILFIYTIQLTSSRSGLLCLVTAVATIFTARFGKRRALLSGLAVLPLVMIVFAGRQTQVDLSDPEDTFQTRLERWSDSLTLFEQSPIFGCGQEQQVELKGQVAHNSFIQSYAELGFFGGACFLGAFLLAITGVYRAMVQGIDPELARFRPFVLAIILGYAIGLLALSRTYTASTYLILGIAAAYINLAPPSERLQLSGRFLRQLVMASVLFIAATYAFVRVMSV